VTAPVQLTEVPTGDEHTCVLALAGELDYTNATALRTDIEASLTPGHRNLILDLTGLQFCDSTGIRVFLGLRRLILEGGGTIALAALNSRLERVFRMTGLTSAFNLFPTLQQASAAIT
jgi:anti-sigma B factor antagonist